MESSSPELNKPPLSQEDKRVITKQLLEARYTRVNSYRQERERRKHEIEVRRRRAASRFFFPSLLRVLSFCVSLPSLETHTHTPKYVYYVPTPPGQGGGDEA